MCYEFAKHFFSLKFLNTFLHYAGSRCTVEGLCLDSTLLFLASELFIYALCCHLVSILSAYAVGQWRFMLYVAELDFFIQYQYPV